MKKRVAEEQIVKTLCDQQQGKRVKDIARDHGLSESTFYTWERKYGDMTVAEVHKLRTLEDGKTRLKRLVADLAPDNQAQKEIIKVLRPGVKKDVVNHRNLLLYYSPS